MKELTDRNQRKVIIPVGLTRIAQPLDILVNHPFKRRLTEIYTKAILDVGRNLGIIKIRVIIQWINTVWNEVDGINSEMIKNSFKYCGITNRLDGSENNLIRAFEKINEEEIMDVFGEDFEKEEEIFIEEYVAPFSKIKIVMMMMMNKIDFCQLNFWYYYYLLII